MKRPWLARVRRWHLFVILALLVAGAVLHGFYGETLRQKYATHHARTKPAVGTYSISDRGAGETDFAIETDMGQFKLKVGSRSHEDLPYGMPLYPGAKLIDSARMDGALPQERGRMMRFESLDSLEQVVDFYRRLTRAYQFRIVMDERFDTMHVLAAVNPQKADGGFQLTVSRLPGQRTEGRMTAGFGQNVEQAPELDADAANALMMSNFIVPSLDNAGGAGP